MERKRDSRVHESMKGTMDTMTHEERKAVERWQSMNQETLLRNLTFGLISVASEAAMKVSAQLFRNEDDTEALLKTVLEAIKALRESTQSIASVISR